MTAPSSNRVQIAAAVLASLAVHATLVVVLAGVVVFECRRSVDEIEATLIDKPKTPIPLEKPVELEIQEETLETDAGEIQTDLDEKAVSTSDFELDVADALAKLDAPPSLSLPTPLPSLTASSMSNNASAFALPLPMSNRTPSGIRSAVAARGGSRRTEEAVLKALDWLAANQNDDGSWGTGKDESLRMSLTSLAALAFFGHGETPASPKYGKTVLAAIKRLFIYSRERRMFAVPTELGQALLTYALSEAFALTGLPAIEKEMGKRTRTLASRMRRSGSKRGSGGLEPSLWNYRALRSAVTAGADVKDLDEIVAKSKEKVAEKALEELSKRKPEPSEVVKNLLAIQLFGGGESLALKKSARWTRENQAALKPKSGGGEPWAVYDLFNAAQAMFSLEKGEGKTWKAWNDAMTRTLLKSQEDDGSWSSPAQTNGGRDGETAELFGSERNLAVYRVALRAMTLEVYYRFEPEFKIGKRERREVAQGVKDDDLEVIVE